MKPHLKLIAKLWYCGIYRGSWRAPVGIGYTPKQAYDDWKQQ